MTAEERAALVRRVVAEMLEVAANRGDRERVARVDEVEAAIDLIRAEVLEEAARVSRPSSHMLGSAGPYPNGYRAACAEIAAAIRAALEAWPGAGISQFHEHAIVLPLIKENTDAEA